MNERIKNFTRRFLARRGFELQRIRTADWTDAEAETVAAAGERTQVHPAQVVMLRRSIEYVVNNGIPGAIVECGVWRGGCSVAMLHTLLALGERSRAVYLYDTFEGMPAPTGVDVCWDGTPASRMHTSGNGTATGSNWNRVALDEVRNAVVETGYPLEQIRFVKGLVEHTIPATIPDQIALLRLDTDFYESTLHELTHLYPRLVRGGVLIIDDYGSWLGSRKAVDEYIARNRLRLLLVRGDTTVRYAVKLDEGP